ncbi:MAG TPA: hypothetical protein VGH54_09655 [Mycobacterium sp.]|jgi:hypothetical protein
MSSPDKALIALAVVSVICLSGIVDSLRLVARRIDELTKAIRERRPS